jgi:hypothetical protein
MRSEESNPDWFQDFIVPQDTDSVVCQKCKEASPLPDWQLSFAGCDSCGEHAVLQCPSCLDWVDMVDELEDPLEILPGGKDVPVV